MRCPIEQPEAAASPTGEPQLIVGGLWGAVQPPHPTAGQPWVEWSAEDDGTDGVPTVVLGRE
jgi:hypothetical protein